VETLGCRLVQQPAHLLLVAVACLALWGLCGVTALRKAPEANVLWVPAVLWFAYAGWEWLVLARTPEADIRVDLLLIWPLIGLATLWALSRTALGWWAARRKGP
jgi:hypothetical protein